MDGATALIYTSSAMNHAETGATAYPTSVIPRMAKPDVGTRFSLGQCVVLVRRMGMRIPTTSLRTGLGMTVVAVSRRAVFNTMLRPAGRCPF